MPHRHWMLKNNVPLENIPDDIHFQSIENKFKFEERRKQVMMEFSLIYVSKVLLERDEERIAQHQIEEVEAKIRAEEQKIKEMRQK